MRVKNKSNKKDKNSVEEIDSFMIRTLFGRSK